MTVREASSPDLLSDSVAVVIPCFNAGPRVRRVVTETLKRVARLIVVDDGSTDGGVDALRDLPVRILKFPRNQGKGFALLAGFRAALEDPGVTCVMVVDADGQHDPSEIPALHEAFLEQEADLVIGARTFDRGTAPWASRLGNTVTAWFTAWLLGRRLPDTQSGYRLHSRRFLDAVIAQIPGGRYETEMAIVAQAIRERRTIASVPIRTIYEAGNPTSHFRKIRDSLRVSAMLLRAFLAGRGR